MVLIYLEIKLITLKRNKVQINIKKSAAKLFHKNYCVQQSLDWCSALFGAQGCMQ